MITVEFNMNELLVKQSLQLLSELVTHYATPLQLYYVYAMSDDI